MFLVLCGIVVLTLPSNVYMCSTVKQWQIQFFHLTELCCVYLVRNWFLVRELNISEWLGTHIQPYSNKYDSFILFFFIPHSFLHFLSLFLILSWQSVIYSLEIDYNPVVMLSRKKKHEIPRAVDRREAYFEGVFSPNVNMRTQETHSIHCVCMEWLWSTLEMKTCYTYSQ